MRRSLALGVILPLMAATAAAQELTFHPLFQDHVVLQREQPIPVWGRAAPGKKVTVRLGGAETTVETDRSGRWHAQLAAMSAGGPYALSARTSGNQSRTVQDVLIGETWLCSGQSNMVLQVHRALDSRAEIAGSANDRIRMMTIGLASNPEPQSTFAAPVRWDVASPATVPEFSAVCLYFARELQKRVDVPMGLIASAWGGSKIQSWMSDEALRSLRGYENDLDLLRLYAKDPVHGSELFGTQWQTWWEKQQTGDTRPWNADANLGWTRAPEPLEAWEKWHVPALAQYNGMVWYRTQVQLSDSQARQDATLNLGAVDEVDLTWLNGRVAGTTSGAGTSRTYPVPKGALRSGENHITVSVLDTYGSGGIVGPPSGRALKFSDGSSVPLDGHWTYWIPPATQGEPPRAPWDPTGGRTVIYNAMIAPLGDFRFRGVLWYQGESNTSEADRYEQLLTEWMADWRARFGADLPFLIVELANHGPPHVQPHDSEWAALREAQRRAVAKDARAALAVTIDIGDPYDIHPANKQEVARRLVRGARKVIYGENIGPSGPTVSRASRRGAIVTLEFTDVEGRLVAYSSQHPIGFELCPASGSCTFAEANVDGNRVMLAVPPALDVRRVRYCWADSPVCNLYDESGLPAGPFEFALQGSDSH
jgi:sialate O-acetylesterase